MKMSNKELITLSAMCETETEATCAHMQMRNAADVLRAQGITHSVGYMQVEEGDTEPTVWRDNEDDTVIRRVPADVPETYEGSGVSYYGATVAVGFRFAETGDVQMQSYTAISDEWEVLA